jgi:hypothetical protein
MPVPCEPRSTGPRDRMARRTSAQRRLRHPVRIIKGRQILLHSAAGPLRIAIPAPILTCDRALLIGVGRNQARINGKAFATNQTGRNARLEHAADTRPNRSCRRNRRQAEFSSSHTNRSPGNNAPPPLRSVRAPPCD